MWLDEVQSAVPSLSVPATKSVKAHLSGFAEATYRRAQSMMIALSFLGASNYLIRMAYTHDHLASSFAQFFFCLSASIQVKFESLAFQQPRQRFETKEG